MRLGTVLSAKSLTISPPKTSDELPRIDPECLGQAQEAGEAQVGFPSFDL